MNFKKGDEVWISGYEKPKKVLETYGNSVLVEIVSEQWEGSQSNHCSIKWFFDYQIKKVYKLERALK